MRILLIVMTLLLAAPALAQEVTADPNGSYQRGTDYRDSNARWDDGPRSSRDTGFWPADAAADVAGVAAGTAGAIATAPFRGSANAYYNNGDRNWSQSYAQRNGFVCQPGTWFVGEDGLRHICQ